MKSRGFTLIEVVITIGIIIVLSAIVFSAIVGYINGTKDTATKADLASIVKSLQLYHTQNGTYATFPNPPVQMPCSQSYTANKTSSAFAVFAKLCSNDNYYCIDSAGTFAQLVSQPSGTICAESICIPSCSGLSCGNDGCGGSCGSCNSGFSCVYGSCIVDPYCGDETCQAASGEDCTSCTADCGECCVPNCGAMVCGNDGCGGSCGSCTTGQSCVAGSCTIDQTCGNGNCNPSDGEDCNSCPTDCGTCPPPCGDGTCNPINLEDCSTCPQDCGACATCGDAICQPGIGEDCSSCSSDCTCTAGSSCSAGICTPD